MKVREFHAASEAAEVLRVLREAFAGLEGKIDPPSGVGRETVESVARSSFLVAEAVDDATAAGVSALVGCVSVRFESDHLYLGRLAVLPHFQRRGVGYALVEAAKERARRAGLRWIRLNVRKQLDGNRRFFERCGFSSVAFGTHEGYTEPTFLKMSCEVLREEVPSSRT